MVLKKQLIATTENSSVSAEARMSSSDLQMHVEVALVKKDVENLQKDVTGIKEKMVDKDDLSVVTRKVDKIESNSTWVVRLILGAILLQAVYWLLRGGLSIPLPRLP